MAEPKDIIFNPSKGISNSPLSENAFSQCIDTDSVYGSAKVNYQTETQIYSPTTSSTFTRDGFAVVMDILVNWKNGTAVLFTTTNTLPNPLSTGTVYYLRKFESSDYYFSVHPTYDDAINNTNQISLTTDGTGTHTSTPIKMYYARKFQQNRMIDSQGNLWEWKDVGDWELLSQGNGSGNGMELYGDYIYLFRGGDIDRYQISTGTTTADWQTESATVSVVGQDDILYMASGNILLSYDGSNYNNNALDLPSDKNITCIAELGRYLALGTDDNKIYLWDRISPSFEMPLTTQGSVEMLIPTNSLIYFVIDNGDLYKTDGSSVVLERKFPRYILDNKDFPSFQFSPNAWRVEGVNIYIGYGSTSTTSPMGVYRYSLDDEEFSLAYIASSLATGGSASDKIRLDAIQNAVDGMFLIGWTQATSSYGIDRVSITKKYLNSAVIYSPIMKLSREYRERGIKHTEISLLEKLRANHSIKVSYRQNLGDNWEEIGTFSTVGKDSGVIDKTLMLQNVQLKVEIKTNNDSYTPSLYEIRLY